ncbi:MAG: amino acid ABC transporter permease [Lachnospiraceae bacterium]|nr:amino acid ABC transporter permease [Lachnospiraceae bacterium]
MIKDTFDLAFIAEKIPAILGALPVTILITVLSLFFGWLTGLVSALGKIKGPAVIKAVLRILTDVIRGIPTVVLLYVVYFGLPVLFDSLFGISIQGWSKITFVVIALAIELGTSSSEMFRSAYNSLKKGQLEAAKALGYTQIQTFVHVIFPQGVFVILPNLGSAVLSIVQATALVYTLGVFDILGKARQIDTNVAHVKTFEMYLAAAAIYWLLAIVIGWIFKLLEKFMGRGKAVVA